MIFVAEATSDLESLNEPVAKPRLALGAKFVWRFGAVRVGTRRRLRPRRVACVYDRFAYPEGHPKRKASTDLNVAHYPVVKEPGRTDLSPDARGRGRR